MTLLLNNLNLSEIDTLTEFFDRIDVCCVVGTEAFYIPGMKIGWGDASDINEGLEQLGIGLSDTMIDRSACSLSDRLTPDNMTILINYLNETEIEEPDWDAPDDEPCRLETRNVSRLEAGKLGLALCELKEYLHGLNAARGYLSIPKEAAA